MKKTAFIIMILTIIAKFLGFGRELALSFFYGASGISDAYIISTTIPNVIFNFIAVAFTAGFIPTFSRIETISGIEEGNKFTNNMLNIMLLLSTFVVIIGFIFTRQIVLLFASGFEGVVLEITVLFTRLSIFAVYFKAMTVVFTGYLQVNGSFVATALISLPMNVIIIVFIALSTSNQLLLPIGFLLAMGSQVLIMLPSLKRENYTYKGIVDFHDEEAKTMLLLALPIMIGTSVNDINILVDRTLASSITTGGVSALNYAGRLNGFIMGIFVLSIITVVYPMMAKMVAKDNIEGVKKVLGEIISVLSLLIVPAMIGSMVFSEEIVTLLFGRGAFGTQATQLTSSALFFYSIGMFSFGIRELLSRVFYTLGDTKTPMINGVIGVLMNIVLNIILSRIMGLGGLALATSIAGTVTSVLLFIGLRKKMGPIGFKPIAFSMVKVFIASLIMGVVAKVAFEFLVGFFSQNMSLIISIGVGVMVYLILIIMLRIKETQIITQVIKRKFFKKASV